MPRKTFFSLTLSLACGLLLAGCSTTETPSSNNSTAPNTNKTATVTSSPATTTNTTTAPATVASGDKVGVPECDDYLEKYEACVTGKIPEGARAQYTSILAQTRKSWRDLAANPQTKATLAQACKTSAESAKQALKTYGCDF